jgi:UDP-N-acetylmuramate--alanine ligase
MVHKPKVYFIGIGGIGISALARYFLSRGWKVSGSDISPSSITEELKKESVKIFIGHHHSHIRANEPITKIIYNQAISPDNPELMAAKKLGIPRQSYPEAVGELTRQYKTIAVAGAHGKSTTTALISLILIEAGLDPTVIIGTKLKEFGGKNFRRGKSNWLILEADEWKGSFWHYSPALAVITNIDREHLDFYKTFAGVKRGFRKFIKNLLPGGALFINKKHSNILKNIRMPHHIVQFSSNQKIVSEIRKVLQIPGEHNVLNALAAYSVAKYLAIPEKTILRSLGKYRGAWRRMEYRGEYRELGIRNQVGVFDDYAHHPAEIKAALTAFRQKWPKNTLICVFQPHQAERLKILFSGFKNAFKAADKVIILPIYAVAGREKLKNRKQKIENRNLSKKLVKAIDAIYVDNPSKNLKSVLESIIRSSHHSHRGSHNSHYIIVMMGAGDIVNYTDMLLSNQKSKIKNKK